MELNEDFAVEVSTVSDEIEISRQALQVLGIAEEALTLFLYKNQGYGDTSQHLGSRGQYADIWRKVGKLKHTLWDGNEPTGESIEEMLMDLVGHCLLGINFIREEKTK